MIISSVSTPAAIKVRAAAFSLLTGLVILGLKAAGYLVTGSVALLSDAAESIVNVVAANIALISLVVAGQPPDEGHQYGHAKAEYVSSATEGALIGLAGVWIVFTAVNRLVHPQPLSHLPLGLALMSVAAIANLAVAVVLLRISRAQRSVALEASARHLLSDVLTSAGVLLGLGLVALTGWAPLDSIGAIIVGGHIAWMGVTLCRQSLGGLMDTRLPPEEEGLVKEVFDTHGAEIVDYHAMRTRQAGADRFIDLHLVLHRSTLVGDAHALCDHLEQHVKEALPGVDVTIHVEPCDVSCARCRATTRSASLGGPP